MRTELEPYWAFKTLSGQCSTPMKYFHSDYDLLFSSSEGCLTKHDDAHPAVRQFKIDSAVTTHLSLLLVQ